MANQRPQEAKIPEGSEREKIKDSKDCGQNRELTCYRPDTKKHLQLIINIVLICLTYHI